MVKLKGSPRAGLCGATLGFFIGFAAVALFGPTAKIFRDLMGLTPGQVGLLVAIPSLSGSLLRIPFGAWVDATGGRKPLLILLGLGWAGMLGLSLVIYFLYPHGLTASMYPLLLILGVLVGCAVAIFSVGISQVSYWFPQKKQGFALGAYAGLGNLAPGIFSLLIPVALPTLGLTGSYVAWLLFFTTGIVIYWFAGVNAYYFQLREQGMTRDEAIRIAREKGQEIFPRGGAAEGLFHAARIWKTWALVAVYFVTFGGFIALTAWLPTYWSSFFKMPALSAGLFTAMYSILSSLIRIWGGSVSDKVGGTRTGIFALAVMFSGAMIMTISHDYLLSLVGEVLMASGMGVANAAVFKLVPAMVPEAVGGATGWVGGLGAFGGFVFPPLMGLFVQLEGSTGYASGFIIFVALALVSMGILLIFERSVRAEMVKTRV
ncbi:MAG: MFS transporter [Thermoanaerobacteraceae bacterium]|nr:MFS transporter [Thermoanaerobacteraceae bacterium]